MSPIHFTLIADLKYQRRRKTRLIVSSLPSPSDDEEKAKNNPDVDFDTSRVTYLPYFLL